MKKKSFHQDVKSEIANSHIVTIKDYSDKDVQLTKEADDIKLLIEQYKVVADSLRDVADTREKANSFWVTVNSLLITALASIGQVESLSQYKTPTLLGTLLVLGIVLCISWVIALLNVQKIININDFLLVELEKHLPAKVFTTSLKLSGKRCGKTALTFQELMVPCLFLVGYGLFSIGLFLL